MLVVDTSAVVEVLVAVTPPPGLLDRLIGDGDLHAPHLVDVEFLSALRRFAMTGAVSNERAADFRGAFSALRLTRHSHSPLTERVWDLRNGLSAYDATFVALAELLDVPLITCDSRLAGSSGHHAVIELYEPE